MPKVIENPVIIVLVAILFAVSEFDILLLFLVSLVFLVRCASMLLN